LIGLFALAALFLASAGIYGTVSYFVARRTRELGIRIALGAARSGVVGLVVRRGVRLAVWGVVIGLFGVWATLSTARTLVYGVSALDPLSLIAGCLVLGLAAIFASALPATRAVRVSPTSALRSE
jgi:ABC-type antimicrobial peptide transport system permease subunit